MGYSAELFSSLPWIEELSRPNTIQAHLNITGGLKNSSDDMTNAWKFSETIYLEKKTMFVHNFWQ